MSNPPLYAPWRMQYIRSIGKPEGKCFLCDAAEATTDKDRRDRLVLWASERSIVLINRFPYTNGHLMVAPKAHLAELEDLDDATLLDLQQQTAAAIRLLKRAVSAQGVNIGINLGRCAGAGVPHAILTPDAPVSGNMQNWARTMRYRLIEAWRQARGLL